MGRELLVDALGLKLSHLQESAGEAYVFRGKFAQSDTPTANKRIYPRELWEREIKRLEGKIVEGKIYGELDHPEDGKTKLQRVAVLIRYLSIDEAGQVIGEMKILDTSMGKELKAIVDGGGAVGVSSRGYGSVRMNENGDSVVQNDFTLLTFDPVADPAEESAYPVLSIEADKKPETKEPEPEPSAEESKVPSAWNESVDRNRLNKAIKNAKAIYSQAIKESDHKVALNRAVSEAGRDLGNYDMKDFAVDVAAEVMTVAKKPTTESSNTGSTMDTEAILAMVKKTVQESMDAMLAEKDQVIAQLKAEIKLKESAITASTKCLTESQTKVDQLFDVSKELGFGLYLQQHLGKHPKLKQIKESLGDLTLINSLEDLQNKIKVHISEVTRITESEETYVKKLTEEIRSSKKDLSLKEAKIATLTGELEEAITIGFENASALYLERRITANPYQSEIRTRFKEMKDKTKANVDKLLKEYVGRRINESGDFHRVRRSLQRRPVEVINDQLVEDHVRETKPMFHEDQFMIDGQAYNMQEIKRLSGMKK